MDRKGAQELARVIAKLERPVPTSAIGVSAPVESAAPIYRWFGIEPPGSDADEDAPDPRA
jgi:hypothetical protein